MSSLYPSSGPVTGETLVTISGGVFSDTNEIIVMFGNGSNVVRVNGTYVNDTHVACMSPAFDTTGNVTVEVGLNGQQFTTNEIRFLYYGMCGVFCAWHHV